MHNPNIFWIWQCHGSTTVEQMALSASINNWIRLWSHTDYNGQTITFNNVQCQTPRQLKYRMKPPKSQPKVWIKTYAITYAKAAMQLVQLHDTPRPTAQAQWTFFINLLPISMQKLDLWIPQPIKIVILKFKPLCLTLSWQGLFCPYGLRFFKFFSWSNVFYAIRDIVDGIASGV